MQKISGRTRGCNFPKAMDATSIDGKNSLDLTKNKNYKKKTKEGIHICITT